MWGEGQKEEAKEERREIKREQEGKGAGARAFPHEKGHHFKLSLHHPESTDALLCDSRDHRHN